MIGFTTSYNGQDYDTDRPPVCAPQDIMCIAIGRALSNLRQVEMENDRRAHYMGNCIANAVLNGRPGDPLCNRHAALPMPSVAQAMQSGLTITATGETLRVAIDRIAAEAIAAHEAKYPQFAAAVRLAVTDRSSEIDAPAVQRERIAQARVQAAVDTATQPAHQVSPKPAPTSNQTTAPAPPTPGASTASAPDPPPAVWDLSTAQIPENIPAWAWGAAAAAALLMVVN